MRKSVCLFPRLHVSSYQPEASWVYKQWGINNASSKNVVKGRIFNPVFSIIDKRGRRILIRVDTRTESICWRSGEMREDGQSGKCLLGRQFCRDFDYWEY